jgi:hypothetical protein
MKLCDSDVLAWVRGQRNISQVLGAFGLLNFTVLLPVLLGARFETYEQFIYLISHFFPGTTVYTVRTSQGTVRCERSPIVSDDTRRRLQSSIMCHSLRLDSKTFRVTFDPTSPCKTPVWGNVIRTSTLQRLSAPGASRQTRKPATRVRSVTCHLGGG